MFYLDYNGATVNCIECDYIFKSACWHGFVWVWDVQIRWKLTSRELRALFMQDVGARTQITLMRQCCFTNPPCCYHTAVLMMTVCFYLHLSDTMLRNWILTHYKAWEEFAGDLCTGWGCFSGILVVADGSHWCIFSLSYMGFFSSKRTVLLLLKLFTLNIVVLASLLSVREAWRKMTAFQTPNGAINLASWSGKSQGLLLLCHGSTVIT